MRKAGARSLPFFLPCPAPPDASFLPCRTAQRFLYDDGASSSAPRPPTRPIYELVPSTAAHRVSPCTVVALSVQAHNFVVPWPDAFWRVLLLANTVDVHMPALSAMGCFAGDSAESWYTRRRGRRTSNVV